MILDVNLTAMVFLDVIDFNINFIAMVLDVNFDENVRIIIPESTTAETEVADPCPHLNLTQYYHINPPDRARFGHQNAG